MQRRASPKAARVALRVSLSPYRAVLMQEANIRQGAGGFWDEFSLDTLVEAGLPEKLDQVQQMHALCAALALSLLSQLMWIVAPTVCGCCVMPWCKLEAPVSDSAASRSCSSLPVSRVP